MYSSWARATKSLFTPAGLLGVFLLSVVMLGNVQAAVGNLEGVAQDAGKSALKDGLQTNRWLGYWNLTTSEQANVVTSSGAGPFTYCSSQPSAAFSATEGALLFNPPTTYQYMGHVGLTPQTTTAVTVGMRVKNLMHPQRALAILEVGPSFRSVESALSGNNSGTYFTTVTSPGGDELFSGLPYGGDPGWHWVIMTADYSTKMVRLYVDGAIYSSMTSSYAPSSVSVGAVFVHCWQNQWSLVSHVFCYRGMIADSDIVSLSNGVAPDSQGMLLPPPSITSATSASAMMGMPFSYQIEATNNPTAFTAGGLPTGLAVNNVSGLISGTPVAPGLTTVVIGASNASGSASASLVLTVSVAGTTTASAVPVIQPSSQPTLVALGGGGGSGRCGLGSGLGLSVLALFALRLVLSGRKFQRQ